jgi:membrane associated rhomboid family serine protease
MIPLRDTIPSRRWPVMNILLILASLLIFFYQIKLLQLDPDLYRALIDQYGLIPVRFLKRQALDTATLLPFLSYIFLHGSWLHVIGNLWALWLFGDNVEDRMGSFRYLAFYLTCGIVAGLVHVWSDPLSKMVTIGGSGAIAGVMGAYFVMYPTARIVTLIPIFFIPFFIRIPAVIYLGVWLLTQVYSMVLSQAGAGTASNIAFAAHVGGFVGGMILQPFYRKSRYR